MSITFGQRIAGGAFPSARRIRKEMGRFSGVKKADLVALFPAIDAKLSNDLTRKFNRDADPLNIGTS